MDRPTSFTEIIQRLKDQEGAAREELLRSFEPAIRRVAHRMMRRRLRSLVDTGDIIQSVLRSFYADLEAGKYAEDDPGRLGDGVERVVKLLKQRVRNKVADYGRRLDAAKRGGKMVNVGPVTDDGLKWDGPSPPEDVIRKEEANVAEALAKKVLEALSAEEKLLWLLRAEGRQWADIAREVGGTAESCRKKLERGWERAVRDLGLQEPNRD